MGSFFSSFLFFFFFSKCQTCHALFCSARHTILDVQLLEMAWKSPFLNFFFLQKLLKWITTQTSGYAGVAIRDLCVSWTDGLGFCALLHRYAPNDIPFGDLTSSSREECMLNLELAFSVAHSRFSVPSTLLPSAMLAPGGPDKIAVFAYLSSLYEALHHRKATGKPPRTPSKSPSSSAKKFASYISPRRLMHRVAMAATGGNTPSSSSNVASSAPSPSPSSRSHFGPTAASSGKVALLRWCQKRCAEHVPAHQLPDFRNCWKNGLALCALAHSYFPHDVPMQGLSGETEDQAVRNVRLAFEVLERRGGVPRLLDVEDLALVKEVEPQSLMTYLSTARRILDSDSSNPLRSPPPQVSPTSRKLVFQPDVVVLPTAAAVFRDAPVSTPAKTPVPSTPVRAAAAVVAAAPPKSVSSAVAAKPLLVSVSSIDDVEEDEEEEDDMDSDHENDKRTPIVSTPIRSSSARKRSLVAETPAPRPLPAMVAVPPTPLSAKRKRFMGARKLDLGTVSVEDVSKLSLLSLETISATLQERYAKDEIYTWCGQVLLSVNPFRPVPALYSLDQVKRFQTAEVSPPPHLFAVGRRVLEALKERRNQSVVISGESGAGKTQATNILVSFLGSSAGFPLAGLQHKMMASSVVLEAMGNAKTARNDNSSRFGKLFKICFGSESQLVGALVEAYLLEVTRVTAQAQGERNFHIFYQMCAGASADEKATYKVQSASHFALLKGCTSIGSVNDAADWVKFKDALTQLSFPAELQQDLFRMLSAILHLGNVSFVESTSSRTGTKQVELARDGSEAALKTAAELMGMQAGALHGCLTRRIIKASARDSMVHKPLSMSQAKEGRDTLCRVLYNKLFFMVVDSINVALAPSGAAGQKGWDSHCLFVGLLDLFGFENFETGNHFEQMMVNYANEKMQLEFLQQVLQQELREYAQERVDFQIKVPDNSACVELFEHRTRGIIAILDDECRMEDATAQSFVGKLAKEWAANPNLSVPKLQSNKPSFTVNHYAEPVIYSTHAFRSRNQHVLRDDLMENVAIGGRPLLAKLFQPDLASGDRGGRAGKVTVGRRFRASLAELSNMLAHTAVSWIRCIKPNPKQKPQSFDSAFVCKQLAYLGMLSVAQLRQDGYPIRISFAEFCSRYAPCLAVSSSDVRKVAELMARATAVSSTRGGKRPFEIGVTRVFLSQEMWEACEDLKEEKEEEKRRQEEEKKRKEEERKRKEEEERKRQIAEAKRRKEQAEADAAIAAAAAAQPKIVEMPKPKLVEASPESRSRGLLFRKAATAPNKADPVVAMVQGVAAGLEGSLQGALSILELRRRENSEWCDDVLRQVRDGEQAALSSMQFGRYRDVKSPEQYEPASEAAKRTLRRTLRKSPGGLERELREVRAEKAALEQEVSTLRGVRREGDDRKALEAELERARVELNAVKRGRVEDALRRRAALKRQKTPPPDEMTPLGRGRRGPTAVATAISCCEACQRAIGEREGGGVVRRGGERYHVECWKCTGCDQKLPHEEEGQEEEEASMLVTGRLFCRACGEDAVGAARMAASSPAAVRSASKRETGEEQRLRERLAELGRKEEELRRKEEQLAEKEAREQRLAEERARQKQILLEQREEKGSSVGGKAARGAPGANCRGAATTRLDGEAHSRAARSGGRADGGSAGSHAQESSDADGPSAVVRNGCGAV